MNEVCALFQTHSHGRAAQPTRRRAAPPADDARGWRQCRPTKQRPTGPRLYQLETYLFLKTALSFSQDLLGKCPVKTKLTKNYLKLLSFLRLCLTAAMIAIQWLPIDRHDSANSYFYSCEIHCCTRSLFLHFRESINHCVV